MISFGIYIVFVICVLGTTITGEFTYAAKIKFKKKMYQLHNIKRAEHGAERLKYNHDLSTRAEYIIRNRIPDVFIESIGINVYTWTKPNKNSIPSADYIFSEMYNMGNNYNYDAEPLITDEDVPTAFTQIIWSGSKECGIAIINGDDKCIIAIAYRPRGNEIGFFKKNVFRPTNNATSSSKND